MCSNVSVWRYGHWQAIFLLFSFAVIFWFYLYSFLCYDHQSTSIKRSIIVVLPTLKWWRIVKNKKILPLGSQSFHLCCHRKPLGNIALILSSLHQKQLPVRCRYYLRIPRTLLRTRLIQCLLYNRFLRKTRAKKTINCGWYPLPWIHYFMHLYFPFSQWKREVLIEIMRCLWVSRLEKLNASFFNLWPKPCIINGGKSLPLQIVLSRANRYYW